MKIVFYSKDAQFELTNEEFRAFTEQLKNNRRVYIERLGVFLTDMFIWAGEKPNNRIELHDGGYAILKNGQWILENDESIKLDLQYYPELTKDEEALKRLN